MAGDLDQDIALRASCFAQLAILVANWGEDLPFSALAQGFDFQGAKVPYLNRHRGIFRAGVQRGPAALSINSSYIPRVYEDMSTPDGVLYAYQGGAADIDNRHNRALRAAAALQVPIVYFVGTRKNHYRPIFPAFLFNDDPQQRRVLVTFGKTIGNPDEPDWKPIEDVIERRYVVRQQRQRLHQAQFRGAVLPAYHEKCAICSLKETRLLDAAHIVGDLEEFGEPVVSNGVSLCTIHHRAYDQDLVGISPDARVHVSRRLLEEQDGPMLELLKGFHGRTLLLPERPSLRPDPTRLALRFERFTALSG